MEGMSVTRSYSKILLDKLRLKIGKSALRSFIQITGLYNRVIYLYK